ncbi:helix-turn-helix domain-containing protein [Marinobacter subterrani]|uniref:helix-turn-helix domain-containing protein n=1 Tax=Marinobacter subterrani TaxID=1658765 RepID=UPI0018CD7ECE|nr:helix-turn-helix transcriptional regulator [Marinobacter subterrani]
MSEEQIADSKRLKRLWELEFKGKISQEEVAYRCGWKTQGAFNQYLNGKIPIGLPALLKISRALDVSPSDISPRLAAELSKHGIADFEFTGQPYAPGSDNPPANVPPEFSALLSKATLRSYKQLMQIAEAAADGRLTDADINLLTQIANRIAAKE